MPLARVVAFDGVDSARMAQMKSEMEGSERPENVPAKEIIVLHDPEADKSLVIVFFENEADYKTGDETLSAMPAGDTPGKRTSVAKYQSRSAWPTSGHFPQSGLTSIVPICASGCPPRSRRLPPGCRTR